MQNDSKLRPLLDARSVAVVGAVPPRTHAKLASKPVTNLQRYGFAGNIYPVNPRYEELAGLPCYPSLEALPESVDAVMILRRADQVTETIEEMARLDLPAAVVCSGGFAEAGSDGLGAQAALAEAAARGSIALCGPNTNGVLNFRSGMMLGFHPVIEQDELLRPGGISIVSHSGTVTGAVMSRLQGTGAGFGYVISAGNEAHLQAADYMDYLAEDPETETVVLYLEQIRDGERFRSACSALREAGKTVLALKAGASDDAARVAFGHTGALVGSYTAFTAAARDSGVAVCQGLEELVALARVGDGGRTTISGEIVGLSMSGGLNGLMADAVNRAGARFCELDEETIGRLREVVPIATPANPFDLTGLAVDRPGVLRSVLDILHEGTSVDEFVFSLGLMPNATWPEWAEVCHAFQQETGTRLSVYAAAGRRHGDGYEHFERAGIGVFDSIEPLLRALVSLSATGTAGEASPSEGADQRTIPDAIPADVPGRRALLGEWGLPYVPYAYVTTPDEAVKESTAMGYPVALKVASEQIAHKAKLGLLELDVNSDEQAELAFARLAENFERAGQVVPDMGPLRVEVQKMLPRSGLEVFVGGKVDSTFGPVISVGLGGALVESIADLSSAMAPLGPVEAEHLLASAPSLRRALDGSKLDETALIEVLCGFSRLLADLAPVLDEVECNPVVVFESGAYIIDDLWKGRGE